MAPAGSGRMILKPDRQLDLFGGDFAGGRVAVESCATPTEAEDPWEPRAEDSAIAEAVDGLLLERGEVHLADGLDRLRNSRQPHPSGAQDAAARLLDYALAQGLVPFDPDTGEAIAIGAAGDPTRQRAIRSCVLRPPPSRDQSDLFQDGAPAIALRDVQRALAAGRADEARAALERMQALAAADRSDYASLLAALDEARLPLPPELRLRQLQEEIVPRARRRLGPAAQAFLSPLWMDLGRRLESRPFQAGNPELHASHAYAEAECWALVVSTIAAEAVWPQEPALAIRMANARVMAGDRAGARKAWMALFWDHPREAEHAIEQSCRDAALSARWQQFCDADLGFETEDFPAWLLVSQPQQREWVPPQAAGSDGNARAAYAILHRMLANGGAMEDRRALQKLRPGLLRLFVATRP